MKAHARFVEMTLFLLARRFEIRERSQARKLISAERVSSGASSGRK